MAAKTRKVAKPGFKKIERPTITKWNQGMTWAGTVEAVRDMGEDEKGNHRGFTFRGVNSETGEVEVIGCPAILVQYFEMIGEPPFEVSIECLGRVTTRSGRSAWDFDVYVKE